MKILVTGSAGFIGFHLSNLLLKANHQIFGIDNLNDYYDVKLKKDRLIVLKKYSNFFFNKIDLAESSKINNLIKKNKIKYVIHLAAQAGVRHSIENPTSYFQSNIEGFFNILETCKQNKIKHLIFASTSSVYGDNNIFPLREELKTDTPLSFYAASKKANELMAHSYSNIYKLPCTGVRFFTVYGPFGRPDMALFKFTKEILSNKKINLFNNGQHERDFTYVDDIIQGINLLLLKPSTKEIPYNVFNIGNGKPKTLIKYLEEIEKNLKKKALINNKPLQKGDIIKTHASIRKLQKYTGYAPTINISKGITEFIKWFKNYYRVSK